jgi:hypothetical protein
MEHFYLGRLHGSATRAQPERCERVYRNHDGYPSGGGQRLPGRVSPHQRNISSELLVHMETVPEAAPLVVVEEDVVPVVMAPIEPMPWGSV